MVVAGLVLAGVAAAIHVYVFVLESLAWTGAKARATFGTTPEQARDTRSMAFNQGFYNLFLSVEVAVGVVVLAAGSTAVGATLVFVGAGSMVAAGLVLLLSDRTKTRPALIQLTPPLLGVALLAAGLAS
jgi:putative membrane protein